MHDYLPPEFAIPAAIVATVLFLVLEFRAAPSDRNPSEGTDRPGR